MIIWQPTVGLKIDTVEVQLGGSMSDVDWVSEWFRHGSGKPYGASCFVG